MRQTEGIGGWFVDGVIRRSVRARFRRLYWDPPAAPLMQPCILVANHHNWFDGYVMYHLATKLGIPCLDWIAEFDAFPLFAKAGGMPFPPGDPARRAATVKRTIRKMKSEGWSMMLFAEGTLHYPPKVWELGEALDLVAAKTGATIYPVALRYEFAMHERPECWVRVGEAIPTDSDLRQNTRVALEAMLAQLGEEIRHGREFAVLAQGTDDVNERWDMRRRFGKR